MNEPLRLRAQKLHNPSVAFVIFKSFFEYRQNLHIRRRHGRSAASAMLLSRLGHSFYEYYILAKSGE